MEPSDKTVFNFDKPLKTADGQEQKPFSPDDLLVIEHNWLYRMLPVFEAKNLQMVVFNQNTYHSFPDAMIKKRPCCLKKREKNAFLSPHIAGTLLVSQDNLSFFRFFLPQVDSFLIRLAPNYAFFPYTLEKKKQMAYMPRKGFNDALEVIHALKARNRLKSWTFFSIQELSPQESARVIGESALFLSFSFREGLGLPPAEAMASGSAVVGYDGMGGREFFKGPLIWPVREGDMKDFVEKVEEMALLFEKEKGVYEAMGKKNAEFIRAHSSEEQERGDLKKVFAYLLQKTERQ